MKLRWRFGIISALFLTIFALYPQFKIFYLRGIDWQGSFAYNDLDEVAYSAYLRALIDGRPRKNDPYTHKDDSTESPQEESLFSIQFATPYTIAIPARILGISASTAMILAGALAGFFAALACFWLLWRLTENEWLAMAGSLIILCGGALAAGEGAIGELIYEGISYPYFPFLRRYIPAVPFPFFFLLIGSVWALIKSEEIKKQVLWGVIAAFSFSFLVFSYFYLWTTAAAWLFAAGMLWLIIRPENWQKALKGYIALGAACLIPLAFYAFLLSHRSHTMDDVQLLVLTREPDLWRIPEIIGYLSIVILILGALFKILNYKDASFIFCLSFSLVPIIVFNQQIISGRSLQPIHYQVFIGNYVALLALISTLGILCQKLNTRYEVNALAMALLAFAAISWGFIECHYTVRVSDDANFERDKGMEMAHHLEGLDKNGVILPISMLQGDDLPTIAPQPVLWARHQHVFAGVTWQENKERYYRLLYYQNVTEENLAYGMKNGDFVSIIALFGWGRHTDRLNAEYQPLSYREIDEEARKYGEYIRNFSLKEASGPLLSCLLIPNDWIEKSDLSNLDFWYERGAAERYGSYTLYRLKLRNQAKQP